MTCYHPEIIHGVLLNYPTYDKKIYTIVQAIKKWKNYLMGKETIIYTNHKTLQYLHAQSKLQQTKHYKWIGILQ
jgi:hypothetical protein